MCYEFVHACQSLLIEELTRLIGSHGYFLLCFGHLNYLYSNDIGTIQRVFDLLESKGIALHEIEEADLLSVIDAQYMRENHTFHGNIVLLNKFREKSEII